MAGQDFSINNLQKHLFVNPNDTELPWVSEFPDKDNCKDILGARLLPAGHKNNTQNTGGIFFFGKQLGLITYNDKHTTESASPAFWMTTSNATYEIGNTNWDIANVTTPVPGSVQYWQRNIRFCRPLSDSELGYKLWRDNANDQIVVTTPSAPQPAGTAELPKGLLRGMAVRRLNSAKTRVAAPLSQLLAEIEKTKDQGEYKWIGWQ